MTSPDLLVSLRCAVLHGRGVAGVGTLPALLAGVNLVSPRQANAAGAQAVLAWGRKPSAERALAWGRSHDLQPLWLEDGFLRSIGLGADEHPGRAWSSRQASDSPDADLYRSLSRRRCRSPEARRAG